MPAPARTSDLTVLVAGGVALLALTVVSFLVAPPDDGPRETGSSYSPAPEGAKAAYLLLEALGRDVERSFDPFATLHVDPSRTLVIVADPTQKSSEQDRAALLRFVESGGVVLATGASAAEFLPGVTAVGLRPRSGELLTFTPAYPSPLATEVPSIRLPTTAMGVRRDVAEAGWIPLFTNRGAPGVLTARRGQGRLIWWSSSRPLSNGAIAEAGHTRLLMNAIGPPTRRILWDEHYHGHARSLWSYAYGTPVAWGLVQIGLIAAVAWITVGRYLGPPRSRVVVPRTSPLEFIETMGRLYERAAAAGAALASARTHVRRQLVARAGIPASSSDERLATALSERFGVDATEVRALLGQTAEGSDSPIVEAKAVALVKRLQQLAADVGPNSYRLPASSQQLKANS